jgi:hypothetical protein
VEIKEWSLFPRDTLDMYEKPMAENGATLALLVPLRMVPRFEDVCLTLEIVAWSPERIGVVLNRATDDVLSAGVLQFNPP